MIDILIHTVLLFISLTSLVLASDIFVDASSSLAIRLRVPKMIIALTIAAFGTCAPELAISFNSIITGNAEMTLANVIGSCIVNILLIVGIAAIIKPIKIKENTIRKEFPILFLITTAFFILLNDRMFFPRAENGLSRADALLLICWFAFFMYYIFSVIKAHKRDIVKEKNAKYTMTKSIVYIIITLVVIVVSSNIAVNNAAALAEKIGISQKIIAMTVIVIGTSLPELTMTVSAAKKGEFDMAVGNIIGTNIFNICVVLGLPILIFGGFTSSSFNIVDSSIVLLSAGIFYLFGKSDKELSRFEGVIMICIFIAYYIHLFLA